MLDIWAARTPQLKKKRISWDLGVHLISNQGLLIEEIISD